MRNRKSKEKTMMLLQETETSRIMGIQLSGRVLASMCEALGLISSTYRKLQNRLREGPNITIK
jgi:hypothetical protein